MRSLADAHRGRAERARARRSSHPIAHAERAGRAWWEALLLSALAFIEHIDGNHTEVDRALTRMHDLMDSVGVRYFLLGLERALPH